MDQRQSRHDQIVEREEETLKGGNEKLQVVVTVGEVQVAKVRREKTSRKVGKKSVPGKKPK